MIIYIDLIIISTIFVNYLFIKTINIMFKEKTNSSYASFNRTLDKLEVVRLIDTKYTGKGVRGNSREIILRFNPEDYEMSYGNNNITMTLKDDSKKEYQYSTDFILDGKKIRWHLLSATLLLCEKDIVIDRGIKNLTELIDIGCLS